MNLQIPAIIPLPEPDDLKLGGIILVKESDGHPHHSLIIHGDILCPMNVNSLAVIVGRIYWSQLT